MFFQQPSAAQQQEGLQEVSAQVIVLLEDLIQERMNVLVFRLGFNSTTSSASPDLTVSFPYFIPLAACLQLHGFDTDGKHSDRLASASTVSGRAAVTVPSQPVPNFKAFIYTRNIVIREVQTSSSTSRILHRLKNGFHTVRCCHCSKAWHDINAKGQYSLPA